MDAAAVLRRSRRLLWLGSLAVLVVGSATLGWSAAGLPWSAAERAALLTLPASWAGVLAATAVLGSPGIRHRRVWALVALVCSLAVSVVAAVALKPALNAEPGAAADDGGR